jgi:carboxymethylenebutenolidase
MTDTVNTARDLLLAQTGRKTIGVVGFSMGAAWAMEAAADQPGQIAAAVLFYGAAAADYSQVKARVLGHFSDADEWEPLEGVRAMERDMQAAGVDVTLHIYPKVAHWFVEQDRPEYDAPAAALAWDRTFKFLKQAL